MAVGNQVGRYLFRFVEWLSEQTAPHTTHQKMLAQCRQCSFSPNGDVLVAVFDDATVWRFDYRNCGKKRESNGTNGPYAGLQWTEWQSRKVRNKWS